MSVQIPNGAIATYTGTWNPIPTSLADPLAFLLDSAASVVSAVTKELVNDGLTVLNYNVGSGGGAILTQGPFQVTLNVLNQSGQELDDTDLIQQINDALNIITGSPAISNSVTQVTAASAGGSASSPGVPVLTGQPGQVAAGGGGSNQHQCGDPSWSFFDDPGQWFSCLATKGLSTLGLLFIGLLVGVVLIVAAESRSRVV